MATKLIWTMTILLRNKPHFWLEFTLGTRPSARTVTSQNTLYKYTSGSLDHRSDCKLKIYSFVFGTYPPPMVIIFESAAMNNSAPCPKFLSPSIPTHGYFALSGYNVNKNVSPVPKYAWRFPLSSFRFLSAHLDEQ